jgi:hypothetical protein
MRLFLFKIFYKLAVWAFPCKERSILLEKYCFGQIVLHEKHLAMQRCVRPRTHPKPIEGNLSRVSYTDFYERN